MKVTEGTDVYNNTKIDRKACYHGTRRVYIGRAGLYSPKDFRRAQKARQGPAAGSDYEMAVAVR